MEGLLQRCWIILSTDYRDNAVFDMVAYAFETDLTRVATIGFSPELSYTDVDGVSRGYHACTHNGKNEDVVDELVAIESFQIEQLSKCLKKLDSIKEPNSNGTLLSSIRTPAFAASSTPHHFSNASSLSSQDLAGLVKTHCC